MQIIKNPIRFLQEYYLTLDEGKGSAYERYALNHLISGLIEQHALGSILELPANGVMGIPGIKTLIGGVMGKEVTLVNPSPKAVGEMQQVWQSLGYSANFVTSDYYNVESLKDSSFDLVWNFCVAEHFDDPPAVIREMRRLSKKYVLIVIQNVFNVGYPIHRLYHYFKGEEWDHGRFDQVKASVLVRLCEENDMKVIKVGGVDMPPWPDINMKIGEGKEEKTDFTDYGEAFAALRPSVKLKDLDTIIAEWQAGKVRKYPWWMWGMALWYYLIEVPTPQFIKIFLSHHPYVLAEVK